MPHPPHHGCTNVKVMIVNAWLASLLFHINLPSNFWDKAISSFDPFEVQDQGHIIDSVFNRCTPFLCFASIGSTNFWSKICQIRTFRTLYRQGMDKHARQITPIYTHIICLYAGLTHRRHNGRYSFSASLHITPVPHWGERAVYCVAQCDAILLPRTTAWDPFINTLQL